MAQVELIMPKMGESVAEATITSWLKEEGDTIEADESVVEIATDKVDSEVPSTAEGVLIKKLFNEGDVVQVGQAIAIIGAEGDSANETQIPVSSSEATKQEIQTPTPETTIASTPVVTEKISNSETSRFYSPLVRSIAEKESISVSELESISGTGQNGRVTKKDILDYIPNKNKEVTTSTAVSSNGIQTSTPAPVVKTEAPKPSSIPIAAGDEIIEMDRMRKLIATHMVNSKQTSPHVTSYVEADMTNIVNWRNKIKNEFFARENEKITFTPIIMEAIIKAIKDFPMINISVDGDNIIKRKNINLGMATALPSGNLIVPVIKNADQLNLVGLTKTVNDLATRARNNQLSPDDIAGGTYTMTNVGSFGNVMGTPIINQPQVAIMAVGAIQKKPAVIETPNGDAIAIRHKMFLSHAYDHRVVDGALGGMFVRRVADYLEEFDVNREF
jgi:2-oxoglutarate dehydrogenase E2 component (dihydrolipoamide succinyltransferase)